MQNELLQKFREEIRFLQLIPDVVYNKLSASEFYFPDEQINALGRKLESELDHYVMPYKKDIFDLSIPPQQHLCGILRGAKLNKRARFLLRRYEKESKRYEVTFVVYKKPLEIIDVTTSLLYKYYQQKNLI